MQGSALREAVSPAEQQAIPQPEPGSRLRRKSARCRRGGAGRGWQRAALLERAGHSVTPARAPGHPRKSGAARTPRLCDSTSSGNPLHATALLQEEGFLLRAAAGRSGTQLLQQGCVSPSLVQYLLSVYAPTSELLFSPRTPRVISKLKSSPKPVSNPITDTLILETTRF